jgi:hypothetical protein
MYRVVKIAGPARPYDGSELLALGEPSVGSTMSMYRMDGDIRVFTSPVRRVFESDRYLYAQTHNCVYRFEWIEDLPMGLRAS